MFSWILSFFNRRPVISTPQEVKIRQLLWAEYRAGNNKEQARLNIISKLGIDSVSESTINECFKRFKSEDYSFFGQYKINPAILTFSNGNEVNKYTKLEILTILE